MGKYENLRGVYWLCFHSLWLKVDLLKISLFPRFFRNNRV